MSHSSVSKPEQTSDTSLKKDYQTLLEEIGDRRVVIFDGVCNLCNASVDFIIRRDKKNRFLFTANQNEAGAIILTHFGKEVDDVSTVYLLKDGKLYDRSGGAIRIAGDLGFPYNLLYPLLILPRFLRNFGYNLIAKNRYRWWGKKETCRLPTPEERAKFI